MKTPKEDESEMQPNDWFLLDDELPKSSYKFKLHMAKKFQEMGYDKDKIRFLISIMD